MKEKIGVNLFGFFHANVGLTESCKQIAHSLDIAGIPYSKISTEYLFRDLIYTIPKDFKNDPEIYPINLFCMGQGNIAHYFYDRWRNISKKRHNIALWFWETNYLPSPLVSELQYLDEIWVASRYMEDYLTAQISQPIHYIPQPIRFPSATEKVNKKDFGLSDQFMYLFCFDYNSVEKRKNPGAIIEAFLRAFPNNQQVQLVIKSQNARNRHLSQPYYTHVKNDPRIIWLDQTLTRQGTYDLISICDCYISLHRSEGFGFTMAEAMYFEKPTIATAFSGNLDFMKPENSYLCNHRLIPIGKGSEIYPEQGEWADPDIDHAASLMVHVYHHPDESKQKGKLGKQFILDNHSADISSRSIIDRISTLSHSTSKYPSEFLKGHFWRYLKFQIKSNLKKIFYMLPRNTQDYIKQKIRSI